MSEEEVPLRYETKISASDYQSATIKFERTRGGEKIELKFSIYEDQENYEVLFKLLWEFNQVIDRYDLWLLVGEAKVYDYFQRCLSGDALDTWAGIVDDEEATAWKDNIAELV